MGSLALPPSGVVYIDANIPIYRIESVQPYVSVALPLWTTLDAEQLPVITSELSVVEVLVKPLRENNMRLVTLFQRALYRTRGFECISISRQVLEAAAQLRASIGLKTPDAIHAATALVYGSALFVTNDPAFRRVPGLPVVVLSEVAAAL